MGIARALFGASLVLVIAWLLALIGAGIAG